MSGFNVSVRLRKENGAFELIPSVHTIYLISVRIGVEDFGRERVVVRKVEVFEWTRLSSCSAAGEWMRNVWLAALSHIASRTPSPRLLENPPSHPRKLPLLSRDRLSPASTVFYLDTMFDATPGVLRGSIDRSHPKLLTAVHPNNALCSITSKRWTRNSSTSDNFLSLLPSTTPQSSTWSTGLKAAMTAL